MSIKYVHVQWRQTGAEDMVPITSAKVLEAAGDLTIVDDTPSNYRRFKPRMQLGDPSESATDKPRRRAAKPTDDKPEEATE